MGVATAALGGSRGGGGGDGWLVPRAEDSNKQAMPAYLGDAPQGRSIVNKEGGLPVRRKHTTLTTGVARTTPPPSPALYYNVCNV